MTMQNRSTAAAAHTPTNAGLATLGQVLDGFDEPAFVVTGQGSVVYANRAARHIDTPPRWLQQLPALGARPEPGSGVRITPVEVGSHEAWLVVLPREPAAASDASPTHPPPDADLPPSLARVAGLLVQGMADKQIASLTGLSVATVRTYVRRIYSKLGVHNRLELAQHWAVG
jgi:hypothetical protein